VVKILKRNIICKRLEFRSEDIGDKPMNVVRSFSHALLRDVHRGLGNIEDSDVLRSASDEVVGPRGFAAAYINNGGRKTCARSLNEAF